MSRRGAWRALSLVFLAACGEGSTGEPQSGGPGADAGPSADSARADDAARPAEDVGAALDALRPDATADLGPVPDALAPRGDAGVTPSDAAVPVVQPRPRPTAAGTLTAPEGWRFARGLIHMHSVHSHDACDGDPKPGGLPNAPCLADLRRALCHNRFDYVLLTDHPDSVADVDMVASLLHDPALGDRLVTGEGGAPVGNWLHCDDGDDVLLAAGAEGGLMPVLMTRKPARTEDYRDITPEAAAGLREAGGVILQAHTEKRSVEELAPLGVDGIEIYNLHANVDPRGFYFAEVLPDISTFVGLSKNPRTGPHPDLALLSMWRENDQSLGVWESFLPARRLLGFAGSDIHQNLPPALLRPNDGERLDSYRRLSAWFSNYLLVRDVSLDELRSALLESRAFVCFDLWAPPDGFDFALFDASGARHEMGSELTFAPGATLRIQPPALPEGLPESARSVTLLRIDGGGRAVVAEGHGALEFGPETPGAYLVEVRLRPEHLTAELGTGATFLRSVAWVYSNPIYLR